MSDAARGRVLLVGAGPGDPDLITLRGAEALRRADVVVYDSLVPRELLDLAPARAERIDVGKRSHESLVSSQDEINALLVARARAGQLVVRLKGGDSFVFGRGGEEASACREAGVPFEVVPGVTSALAAPAFAGIPVTDRRYAASFAVVTGHRDPGRPWTSIRWDKVATGADTLVVVMGMRNLEKIVESLLAHGRAPSTPAAVVMEGGTPRQRVIEATLSELPARVREAELAAPAVIVVGDVVRLREQLSWWESGPLFGKRVLVTRAADQADDLVAVLRENGAEPTCVPMTEIKPFDDERFAAALRDLERYDAIVFTSANAVRALGERLDAHGRPAAQIRARVLCVGPGTASAARRAGFAAPEVPASRYDAESLAEAVRDVLPPAGKRFLFPCGSLSRPTLPQSLRDAGARVDEVIVYATAPAEVDASQLRATLVRGELDALTFASPSAVRRFAACLDDASRAAAARTVIASIGAVTAEALTEAGLSPQVMPERAGARALVEALARHFAARARGVEA
jgi:uroporphyrinogen III methyltransferase/synthase